MRMYVAVGNREKYESFSTSRLDGVVGSSADHLSAEWYEDMLVGPDVCAMFLTHYWFASTYHTAAGQQLYYIFLLCWQLTSSTHIV